MSEKNTARVEIASLPAIVVSLQNYNASAATWFDGSSDSLTERQRKVYDLTHSCDSLLTTSKLEDDEAALVQSWKNDLEREAATLAETEFEIAQSEYQENYNDLATFEVMAATAREIVADESGNDWEKYVELEPSRFVEANSDSLADGDEIRYRAIREVLDKTADVADDDTKSYVVDTFVNRVESARKVAVASNTETLAKQSSAETIPDEWMFI